MRHAARIPGDAQHRKLRQALEEAPEGVEIAQLVEGEVKLDQVRAAREHIGALDLVMAHVKGGEVWEAPRKVAREISLDVVVGDVQARQVGRVPEHERRRKLRQTIPSQAQFLQLAEIGRAKDAPARQEAGALAQASGSPRLLDAVQKRVLQHAAHDAVVLREDLLQPGQLHQTFQASLVVVERVQAAHAEELRRVPVAQLLAHAAVVARVHLAVAARVSRVSRVSRVRRQQERIHVGHLIGLLDPARLAPLLGALLLRGPARTPAIFVHRPRTRGPGAARIPPSRLRLGIQIHQAIGAAPVGLHSHRPTSGAQKSARDWQPKARKPRENLPAHGALPAVEAAHWSMAEIESYVANHSGKPTFFSSGLVTAGQVDLGVPAISAGASAGSADAIWGFTAFGAFFCPSAVAPASRVSAARRSPST
eukprot:scaffold4562_cov255-Pinguiococcus_pyrenoidosus.AAC.22